MSYRYETTTTIGRSRTSQSISAILEVKLTHSLPSGRFTGDRISFQLHGNKNPTTKTMNDHNNNGQKPRN